MEDKLIVAYDICSSDVPTLMVARQGEYDMTILKRIQGDEAFGMYHYLTGGAELVELVDKKIITNADKIRAMTNEELAKFLCANTECGSCKWSDVTGCLVNRWLEEQCEH